MDLLASGPERAPRRLPGRTGALLLAVLAVAAAGVAAVPRVRDRERAATALPVVRAVPSGGAVVGGRLRVWLLLEGPPGAAVLDLVPRLPGSRVTAGSVPQRLSGEGYAAVRLDVDPVCPGAVAGLPRAALQVSLDDGRGRRSVRVPFATDGLVATTVRERCSGVAGAQAQADGPVVRPGGSAPGDALRTVVEIGAPGPEVRVVEDVLAGEGVDVHVLTALPLRVVPGTRAELVVDLTAAGCSPDATAGDDGSPYLLTYADRGEVVTRADPALRGRLAALRRSSC